MVCIYLHQWSTDSTELSAVDEAGYVRVWSILGEASGTYALASGRSNIFWQQVHTHIYLPMG